jgi:flagellar protein FlaG
MLIQSISNISQASSPGSISGSGLANDGRPVAVSIPISGGTVQSDVKLNLPDTTPVQSAVQSSGEPVSSTQLQNVADHINKILKQSNKNLEFSVDAATQKPVVKLIETDTGDLIRQFPTEEMLAISSAIEKFQQGVFLKQKA